MFSFPRTFVVLCLLSLAACSDPMSDSREFEPLLPTEGDKVRHAHLFDSSSRTAGKDGAMASLVIVLDSYKLVDRNKLVDRSKLVDRNKLVDRYKLVERHSYDDTFYGLAAEVDEDRLQQVLDSMAVDPDIEWVEPDLSTGIHVPDFIYTSGQGQLLPWGMARIGATQSSTRTGDGTGTVDGVHVYVLDTGVDDEDLNLEEQENHSTSTVVQDLDGHGTHIANTIGGEDNSQWTVGVAPGVDIYNWKVLGDNGQAEESDIVWAIEKIIGRKQADPGQPIVINLSLGTDLGTTSYAALDLAVVAAVDAGIVVVTSAGNEGINAATVTPAHAEGAITVGSFGKSHEFSGFSNFGSVVDILAPGEDILSLSVTPTGDPAEYLTSGTSMATGHVSGAAALFLSKNPQATPAYVKAALIAAANPTVQAVPGGTTNKALWVGPQGIDNITLPPFMQFAVASRNGFQLKEGSSVWSAESGTNASIYSGGDLSVAAAKVAGFGYYAGAFSGSKETFQPAYNPSSIASTQQIDALEIPNLDLHAMSQHAHRRDNGNVRLSGVVELGTPDNPVIWYVGGTLSIAREVTFVGHGVFLVQGGASFRTHTSATDGSSIAIFSDGGINVHGEVRAHLYSNNHVWLHDGSRLVGSAISATAVNMWNYAQVVHETISCGLTEPFWPIGNCEPSNDLLPVPPSTTDDQNRDDGSREDDS